MKIFSAERLTYFNSNLVRPSDEFNKLTFSQKQVEEWRGITESNWEDEEGNILQKPG